MEAMEKKKRDESICYLMTSRNRYYSYWYSFEKESPASDQYQIVFTEIVENNEEEMQAAAEEVKQKVRL